MGFVVKVQRDGLFVVLPVAANVANQYVRTIPVVAVPMNESFIVNWQGAEMLGSAGDYLVIDDGNPTVMGGSLFRATHTQIPVVDDDLIKVRTAILGLLKDRVEFDESSEIEDLADELLALIATIEVSP